MNAVKWLKANCCIQCRRACEPFSMHGVRMDGDGWKCDGYHPRSRKSVPNERVIDMYCADSGILCERVVRCKYCKHYKDGMCMLPDGDGDYKRWPMPKLGFCSEGVSAE